ncbi:hypothetical protein F0358_11230 [Empedobacter brevis]|uniref:hypothetical protein n=1 Tax=Empedobacter brevis TaxID=247 RepID=UPI00123DC73E|nr:hypothetical protein [Empedobacter brevis]QES93239.1 hypothetical protein F0358_11230 [Empedobacter brevis]
METIIKSKWGYFVFFCLTLVALYILSNSYFIKNTNENYRYCIAILSKTNSKGKGGWEYEYQYSYNNKFENGRNNIPKDSLQFYESKIDKRFLVKINKNEWVNRLFFTSRLYINKPIPDSIKEAPSEGWKELPVWAK